MKIQFLYLISLILLLAKGFSQDVIVKTDSSKIEAKILEIRTTEISYKLFNFQDGPLYVVSRNDIAYIVYANGVKEIFQIPKKIDATPVTPYISKDTIFTNPTPPKGSENVHETRVGDYIKFNLQIGTAIYNTFCNVPRKDYNGRTSSDEYKKVNSNQNITINPGLNFIFGNNPYVKHVIGMNYLRTKGEFYYDKYGIGYSSKSKYTSTIDFINVYTGLRVTVFKKIHLEQLIAINITADSKTTRSGTEITEEWRSQSHTKSTINFENESAYTLVETTVSIIPKIAYEIPLKKIKSEIYFSYNISYGSRLPWYMIGISYYPFKKLR